MAFSRYSRSPILKLGTQYGTSRAREAIQSAIKNNQIRVRPMVVRGRERLDTIAGVIYGDARYWWILAAASNIGWGMQIPPGTVINVVDLAAVASLIG